MRKIVVAITAASLAVSMLATAIPAAAAVSGYNSSYAGESAFVALAPGQSNEFQVFFANTGTTAWNVGTTTQVDLAACLDDKVTCNAQDATEAPWNPGTWLSATRYATSTQTSVAPGSVATFKYTVTAPSGVAAGTYHFNGALVLHSTGADINNEGYFQDATVGATGGAATLTSLVPNNGTTAGGTSVTVNGSGFVCTPAFPTVMFGTNAAAVTSCGASVLTVTSPASTSGLGAVTVTVTNGGAAASNGLTFTYNDTTKPSYTSVVYQGSIATVTFSEPVCSPVAYATAATDWSITVNATTAAPTSGSIPTCDTNSPHANGVTSFQLFGGPAAPNGAFVTVTLLATSGSVNANITDASNNQSNAPRTNTTTAAAVPTTAPTITGASGNGGSQSVKVTFSEPIFCATDTPGDWAIGSNVATATNCASHNSQATATSTLTLTMTTALASNTTYTVTYTKTTSSYTDVYGNALATGGSATFTSGAQDLTPPTITDARVVTNQGTTDWKDTGDQFTMTFSEAMAAVAATNTITLNDSDGTTGVITCNGTTSASCVFDSTSTILTVTLLTATPVITITNAGTVTNLQIPMTIQALSGFTDAGGNTPNLPGSADRVIDYE